MTSQWRVDARRSVGDYIKDTNQFVGLSAFTAAVTAGLASAPLVAWLAAIFIIVFWESRFRPYGLHLRVLRAIHDDSVKPLRLLRSCIPAILGYGILGISAVDAFKPMFSIG